MYFFSCCFRYSAPIYPILYILYEILDILWRITFSLPDIHIWKSCNEHRLQMILSPFVLKCHEFWIGLYRCFQVHEINTHWIACDTAKVRSYFLSFIVASLKPTVSPCATQWRKSVSLLPDFHVHRFLRNVSQYELLFNLSSLGQKVWNGLLSGLRNFQSLLWCILPLRSSLSFILPGPIVFPTTRSSLAFYVWFFRVLYGEQYLCTYLLVY